MSAPHGIKHSPNGLPCNIPPAETCQHSSGCTEPAVARSYCEDHWKLIYKPGTTVKEIGLTTSPGANQGFTLPTGGPSMNTLRRASKTSVNRGGDQ